MIVGKLLKSIQDDEKKNVRQSTVQQKQKKYHKRCSCKCDKHWQCNWQTSISKSCHMHNEYIQNKHWINDTELLQIFEISFIYYNFLSTKYTWNMLTKIYHAFSLIICNDEVYILPTNKKKRWNFICSFSTFVRCLFMPNSKCLLLSGAHKKTKRWKSKNILKKCYNMIKGSNAEESKFSVAIFFGMKILTFFTIRAFTLKSSTCIIFFNRFHHKYIHTHMWNT